METHQIADEIVSTADQAHTWLIELSETTVCDKPTSDRWSIKEVVGHLIDSACNNHQRFIRAQESNSLTFPKYDQNSWVEKSAYHTSDWRTIVDLWHLYNTHLAMVIRHIPQHQLDTPCTITPYDTCDLEFIVTDYLNHLHHHLKKIQERIR